MWNVPLLIAVKLYEGDETCPKSESGSPAPQQTAAPSNLRAQVCQPPALTSENDSPEGGDDSPTSFDPQHESSPFDVSRQVCAPPLLTTGYPPGAEPVAAGVGPVIDGGVTVGASVAGCASSGAETTVGAPVDVGAGVTFRVVDWPQPAVRTVSMAAKTNVKVRRHPVIR